MREPGIFDPQSVEKCYGGFVVLGLVTRLLAIRLGDLIADNLR